MANLSAASFAFYITDLVFPRGVFWDQESTLSVVGESGAFRTMVAANARNDGFITNVTFRYLDVPCLNMDTKNAWQTENIQLGLYSHFYQTDVTVEIFEE